VNEIFLFVQMNYFIARKLNKFIKKMLKLYEKKVETNQR
jgi:hypothetical protein